MCEPDLFGSYYNFAQRYGNPQFNGFGWKYQGVSNGNELNSLLSNIMIRYKKEDVLKELPPKTYTYIPLDLDNIKEYNEAENNFIEYIRSTKGNLAARKAAYAETLTQIATLRQLCAEGILSNVIKYINDILETSKEKLVIFAHNRSVIDRLEKEYKDICVKIDGSVNTNIRQEIVDKFQKDDKIRLFIGNIKAAGVGLTLTASSTAIFIQLPWTKADLSQAEDRIHRISQTNKVNIIYLLGKDSIEEKLAKIIDSKAITASKILDNEDIEESNMITALIKEYEDK